MDITEIKEEKTSNNQNFDVIADQISREEISAKFESTSDNNAGTNSTKKKEKGNKCH